MRSLINSQVYKKIKVGTPEQKLKMLFDVNSPNIALPIGPYCEINPSCNANQTFYPEASSSLSTLPCTSSCSCITVHTDQGI